jgi:hypothetical protein
MKCTRGYDKMIIFKNFLFILSVLAMTVFAKAEYLRDEDLKSLVVSCYLEERITVFCSKQQIDNPHIKIYLPMFKSVMIDDKVHAFRIMATIENLSKKALVGAKIKLKAGGIDSGIIEFIINEKIKYKMVSTTDYSHLVRSDVPKVRQTYNILRSAYFNADISDFEMAITELHFD